MNQGLYAAFLGMRARQRTLDVISNNIANASTAGFKAERMFYRSIEAAELEAQQANAQATNATNAAAANAANAGAQTTNTQSSSAQQTNAPTNAATNAAAGANVRDARALGALSASVTDFSAGGLRQTGRPLDVALDGAGFFVVQTPRGVCYTRAGNFSLDANGQLVTMRGELVVGERGAITVPPGEVTIGDDGTLSVNGRAIDKLKIVNFNDARAALVKEGTSLFMPTGAEQTREAIGAKVVQGSLESSNVNPVSEMVAMMQNEREFESLQRSVSMMMNDIGRKVAGELGKI